MSPARIVDPRKAYELRRTKTYREIAELFGVTQQTVRNAAASHAEYIGKPVPSPWRPGRRRRTGNRAISDEAVARLLAEWRPG